MRELPVLRMQIEFERQVRPNAAGAPQLRIVVLSLPCLCRRSKTPHICRQKSDLLRVTVSASFASIDDSAPLFGGGERWHGDGSRPLDFVCQFFSRENRKNKKRKREETYTCTEGDHMSITEPTGRDELV